MDAGIIVKATPAVVATGKKVLKHLTVAAKQRSADPFKQKAFINGVVDKQLDKAIERLSALPEGSPLWKKAKFKLEEKYRIPKALKPTYVQGWLSKTDVRELLRKISKSALVDDTLDTNCFEELVTSLSVFSGDHKSIVLGVLHTTINYLALEIENALQDPVGTALIVEEVSGVREELSELKEEVGNIFGAVASVQEHHMTDAVSELERILKSRFCVSSLVTLKWLKNLQEDVSKTGRLASAVGIIDTVVYWIARIEAGEGRVELAQQYLANGKGTEHNLVILEALICLSLDQVDEAIRLLQNDNTPESNACLLSILIERKGEKDALNWGDALKLDVDTFNLAGWINLLVLWVGDNQFGQIEKLLLSKPFNSFEEYPALNCMLGNVLLCKAFSSQYHQSILDGKLIHVIEHAQDGEKNVKALDQAGSYFNKAVIQAKKLQLEEFSVGIESILSLLRLIDPKRSAVERECLKLKFKKFPNDIIWLSHVLIFDIGVDWSAFDEYFYEISHCRPFIFEELTQRHAAYYHRRQFDLAVNEIESYWEKLTKKEKKFFASKLADACLENGDLEKANALLDNYRKYIPEEIHSRLKLKLQGVAGGNPVGDALALYSEQKNIISLRNLITALSAGRNYDELEKYSLELFQQEYKTSNAVRYIDYAFGNGRDGHYILRFLDGCSDLVSQNLNLKFYKAWALYDIGNIVEAERFFPDLRSTERTEQTITLEINIALALGKYGEITAIVSRELENIAGFSAGFLLSMANVIVHEAPEKALMLAKGAIENEPESQSILLGAHRIASLAGYDELASKWVHTASSISSDNPLVKKVSLSEVVSFMEQSGNDRQHVFKSFQSAQIPIHLFVEELSLPLSKFYLNSPRHSDARCQDIHPFFSLLSQLDIKEIKKISLDITTIMQLYQMGILNNVLDYFEAVKVAPNIMFILHREYSYIHHHQPSSIHKSKRLMELFRGKVLVQNEFDVPISLKEEVGVEDSQLLFSAKQTSGVFVHPGKIYKCGSLMEKDADLGEFNSNLVSLHCLLSWLVENGELDEEKYNDAMTFLKHHGEVVSDDIFCRELVDAPIYLDRLAVDYLYQLELITIVINSDLNVFIHQRLYDEWHEYLALENDIDRLSRELKNIRKILQKALAENKLQFLPRKLSEDDPKAQRYGGIMNAVVHTLGGVAGLDAVSFDDRFLCSYGWIPAGEKQIPILNSYGILCLLQSCGQIKNNQFLKAKKSLHSNGWSTFPIKSDEVFFAISNCKADNGKLKENKEIKGLRERVNFLLGSSFLTNQERYAIIDNCLIESIRLLQLIWNAPSKSDEDIYARATWTVQYLLPPISDVKLFVDSFQEQFDLIVERMLRPLLLVLESKSDRLDLWGRWLQVEVLDKLLPANSCVIEKFAESLASSIVKVIRQILDEGKGTSADLLDYKRQLVLSSLKYLPDQFAQEVYNQKEIVSFCELRHPVGRVGTISPDQLITTYQSVEQTDYTFLVKLLEGEVVSVNSPDVGVLHFSNDKNEINIEVAGLELLSKNKECRITAFNSLAGMCGFIPLRLEELGNEVASNPISSEGMIELVQLTSSSPEGFFEDLTDNLECGKVLSGDLLFPSSKRYYEMLIGPENGASNFDSYLDETLRYQYANQLFENKERVFSYCLPAAIRSDVIVPEDFKSLDDFFLIHWIKEQKKDLTPIELLALLPILTSRTSSEADFSDFIDEAIERLCSEHYGIGNNYPFYKVFAPLLSFCLRVMDSKEQLYDCPAYWKRLAAFVHCQYLIKILKDYVDHEKFAQWCSKNSAGITIGDFLNFHSEPLWMRTELTPLSLQSEVAGRLEILLGQLELQDAHKSKIKKYLDGLPVEQKILMHSCGPLEGGRKALWGEHFNFPVDSALEDYEKFEIEKVTAYLLTLSFCSKFKQSQLDRLSEIVNCQTRRLDHWNSPKQYFSFLHSVAGIAGGQGLHDLSERLSEIIIADCHQYTDSDCSTAGLYALLLAAASLEDEKCRLEWLETKLRDYSMRIPKKVAAEACCREIEQLERMLPLKRQCFSGVIRLLKSCI